MGKATNPSVFMEWFGIVFGQPNDVFDESLISTRIIGSDG